MRPELLVAPQAPLLARSPTSTTMADFIARLGHIAEKHPPANRLRKPPAKPLRQTDPWDGRHPGPVLKKAPPTGVVRPNQIKLAWD